MQVPPGRGGRTSRSGAAAGAAAHRSAALLGKGLGRRRRHVQPGGTGRGRPPLLGGAERASGEAPPRLRLRDACCGRNPACAARAAQPPQGAPGGTGPGGGCACRAGCARRTRHPVNRPAGRGIAVGDAHSAPLRRCAGDGGLDGCSTQRRDGRASAAFTGGGLQLECPRATARTGQDLGAPRSGPAAAGGGFRRACAERGAARPRPPRGRRGPRTGWAGQSKRWTPHSGHWLCQLPPTAS